MVKVRRIVKEGDPILRKHAQQILHFGNNLHQLLDDMYETLKKNEGVGLAAPQVGISKRAIIVLNLEDDELIEMVNPEITEAKGLKSDWEACLSVPHLTGKVPRAASVTVKARDRNGNFVERKAKGRLARIFQHEIDHLNGQLFIDIMTEAEEE